MPGVQTTSHAEANPVPSSALGNRNRVFAVRVRGPHRIADEPRGEQRPKAAEENPNSAQRSGAPRLIALGRPANGGSKNLMRGNPETLGAPSHRHEVPGQVGRAARTGSGRDTGFTDIFVRPQSRRLSNTFHNQHRHFTDTDITLENDTKRLLSDIRTRFRD